MCKFKWGAVNENSCIDAILIRGDKLRREGNYQEAIKAYNEAIRLDPKYGESYYNKADCLMKEKFHADADDTYAIALKCKTLNDQLTEKAVKKCNEAMKKEMKSFSGFTLFPRDAAGERVWSEVISETEDEETEDEKNDTTESKEKDNKSREENESQASNNQNTGNQCSETFNLDEEQENNSRFGGSKLDDTSNEAEETEESLRVFLTKKLILKNMSSILKHK